MGCKVERKGVGKKKDSFQEFNNRGIVGFGGGLTHLGIAQMKAAKRHAINQGKIPKSERVKECLWMNTMSRDLKIK